MIVQNSRIKIKRSTVSGVTPTIPISDDHTDGTWLETDLYIGELFLNEADDTLWIRTQNGIMVVTGTGASPITDYVPASTGGTYLGDITMPNLFVTDIDAASINVSGNVVANAFIGDGSGLTGIVATWDGGLVNLDSVFNGLITFENDITINGDINADSGDININANITTNDITSSGTVQAAAFVGDGSGLTGIPGSGNDYTTVAYLDGNIIKFDRTDLVEAYEVDLSSIVSAPIGSLSFNTTNNVLEIQLTDGTIYSISIDTFTTLTVAGNLTADNFIGDGSLLTNVPGTNQTLAETLVNGNITDGTDMEITIGDSLRFTPSDVNENYLETVDNGGGNFVTNIYANYDDGVGYSQTNTTSYDNLNGLTIYSDENSTAQESWFYATLGVNGINLKHQNKTTNKNYWLYTQNEGYTDSSVGVKSYEWVGDVFKVQKSRNVELTAGSTHAIWASEILSEGHIAQYKINIFGRVPSDSSQCLQTEIKVVVGIGASGIPYFVGSPIADNFSTMNLCDYNLIVSSNKVVLTIHNVESFSIDYSVRTEELIKQPVTY